MLTLREPRVGPAIHDRECVLIRGFQQPQVKGDYGLQAQSSGSLCHGCWWHFGGYSNRHGWSIRGACMPAAVTESIRTISVETGCFIRFNTTARQATPNPNKNFDGISDNSSLPSPPTCSQTLQPRNVPIRHIVGSIGRFPRPPTRATP